jgi:MSHA biogenesis protein MshI
MYFAVETKISTRCEQEHEYNQQSTGTTSLYRFTFYMVFWKRKKKSDSWLALVPQRDGIAAASVTRAGERPAVEFAIFFPGTVDDAALEKAGKEVRAQTRRCTTLLGGGNYQMLTVDAPNVPAGEVKTAVRWRLKDLLDFPQDDATFDVLDIPPDPNATVRPQQTLFVVAARNGVVAARQKMFSAAKVDLSVIDVPEMAQRNISAMLEPNGRGLAMLSFDADGGLLTVSYGGELYLSRRIDIPLAQLVEPDIERRHQSFDRVTLELQRSLDNFERQFSFISVARLVLGPSEVQGLDEYLSSNLYTPVETLDLGRVFDLARAPELAAPAMQQRFMLALGAALRNEERAQ